MSIPGELLPMWLSSCWKLLEYSLGTLVSALGTTWLSICLFSVLIPIGAAGYRFVEDFKTKQHASPFQLLKKRLIAQKFKFMLVALVWTGLFAWAVAVTIYRDHLRLKEEVQRLTLPKYAIAPNDQWANISNLYMALRYLRQPRSEMPEQPCHLTITAPEHNKNIAQMVAHAAANSGCDVIGPNNNQHDLAFDKQTNEGAMPNAVIVHGRKGDFVVDGFGVDLGNVFDVKVEHDLPTDSTSIWIQFGSGDIWRKS